MLVFFTIYNIGRWTKEEHDLFLEGISRYGKEWKKIANLISTRTVVQVRTHAQKYFQRLSKLGSSTPKEAPAKSVKRSYDGSVKAEAKVELPTIVISSRNNNSPKPNKRQAIVRKEPENKSPVSICNLDGPQFTYPDVELQDFQFYRTDPYVNDDFSLTSPFQDDTIPLPSFLDEYSNMNPRMSIFGDNTDLDPDYPL